MILVCADDYTVVMETLGMKYGTIHTKESNKDCKSYRTIDLIFHFTILSIERSNCFDIIYSFCNTGTLTN